MRFFFLGAVFGIVAAALASQQRDDLRAMEAKYKNVATLTAEFAQKQRNAALGSVKESTGRIYVKKPGMFRWETLEPDPSILVSNGHKIWYYTPPFREGERGQVIVRQAASAQSRLAVELLAGQADLRKDFKVSAVSQGVYDLKPLKPAGDIAHIQLFLEQRTDLVYQLILFTTTGNQTELMLKKVNLGPRLPDSMFQFTPPPNTEEVR